MPFSAAAGSVTSANYDNIPFFAKLKYLSVGTGSTSPIQKAKLFVIESDTGYGFELESKNTLQRSASAAGWSSEAIIRVPLPIPYAKPRIQARVHNYYSAALDCALIGIYEI